MNLGTAEINPIKKHSGGNIWPKVIIVFTVMYYLFVSFGHDIVTQWYVSIFNLFGREKMEFGLLIGFTIFGILVFIALIIYFLKQKTFDNKPSLILWIVASISVIGCYQLLIVTNIEMIHFVQYALLALLLCLFIKDTVLILGLIFAGGVLDEFVQFYLHPANTLYLDFNDFMLDGCGGFIGILIYKSLSSKSYFYQRSVENSLKVVMSLLYGLIMVTYFGSLYLGYSVLYFDLVKPEGVIQVIDGRNTFVFSYFQAEQFWSISSYGRKYHILSPIWGTIFVIAQFCIYSISFKARASETV